MKATGNSHDLAKRLGVSRSTVFEILETMRIMGAEIEYNKHRRSYFYVKEKVLAIGFVEKEKLKGGKKIKKNQKKFLQSGFFGLSWHTFALENVFKGK